MPGAPCPYAETCLSTRVDCPEPGPICGTCAYFEPFEVEGGALLGRCRIGQLSGFFHCKGRACADHLERPRRMEGAVPREVTGARPVEVPQPDSRERMAREAARLLRRELRASWGDYRIPAIHPRFSGGRAVLRTDSNTLSSRPIEELFERLCHVKAALERLEDVLGAHPGLGSADRDALARLTKEMGGSLTTFNLLFRNREDGFHGTGAR